MWYGRSKLKGKKSENKYVVQKQIFFNNLLQMRKVRLRFWSFLGK